MKKKKERLVNDRTTANRTTETGGGYILPATADPYKNRRGNITIAAAPERGGTK